MKDRDLYREQAAKARADADAADLANVRERCLRAEAAWLVMADRAEHNQRMRDKLDADKAQAALAAAN